MLNPFNTNALLQYKNVLCMVAHPDDESLFAGGTIARLVNQGATVTVASLTYGNLRYAGTELNFREQQHLAADEFESACKVLGTQHVLLDFLDTVVVNKENLDEYKLAFQNLLHQFQPDLVLTHGSNGEYGNLLHITLNRLLKSYVDRNWHLWTFRARPPIVEKPDWINLDDPASHEIDIYPFEKTKQEAIESYRSMRDSFAKVYQPLSPVLALGNTEYWLEI